MGRHIKGTLMDIVLWLWMGGKPITGLLEDVLKGHCSPEGREACPWRGAPPPKPHPQDCCLLSFLFSSAHFVCFLVWECAKSLGYVRLFCDPMDCSPLGSSVHGIFQARILEWVARPSSGLRDLPTFLISSTLAGKFFATRAT